MTRGLFWVIVRGMEQRSLVENHLALLGARAAKEYEKIKSAMGDRQTLGDPEVFEINGCIEKPGLFWSDGISSADLTEYLDTRKGKTARLAINSPGGSYFEAAAMVSILADHDGDVEVNVRGMCASAATMLLAAGGSRSISPYGMVMIHRSWSWSAGNCTKMRKEADVLEKIDNNMAAILSKIMSKDKAEVLELLEAETWYSAEESVEAGLTQEVYAVGEDANDGDGDGDPPAADGDGDPEAAADLPADQIYAIMSLNANARSRSTFTTPEGGNEK